MRLEYEWEESDIQRAYEDAGKLFLEKMCQNWKARDVDCLGVTICDKIWPTLKGDALPFKEHTLIGDETLIDNTTMVLLPLDRMGQAQGKSNAKSALCYFRLKCPGSENELYSLPIIIKQEQWEDGKQALRDEFNQA